MTDLESYIRSQREKKGVLLMTHIVLGYPSLDESLRVVDAMVRAGVDLMELQIPFSEPIADGPVILRANQLALERGSTVDRCIEAARDVAARHPIPFLFMSYYNVLFRRGVARFVEQMREAGLRGAIVPDLPPEEAGEYLTAMRGAALDPIFIFSPGSSPERMRLIAEQGRGFVYCVARKGVTGQKTSFSGDLASYLERCRSATSLPLAVGFGVESREDVAFLQGKADIAVVGSATLRVIDEKGVDGVEPFVRALAP